MYLYNDYDQQMVQQRVEQFRHQTRRFLEGSLSEDAYRPLRLQNGLYIQRYAPMLRIAIPYGQLNSVQLRQLAYITRKYDRGYAHVSTRQNIQLNWPKLEDVPDILAALAQVQMHSIQTSGNCIRNTTTDPFGGRIQGEIEDPRPWCELIRQWSTFHPEFSFLPRKFKIAVNAHTCDDRAAITVHDIGIQLVSDANGNTCFNILVGGGLGRTPIVGVFIKQQLPAPQLLSYLEAIVRVYNLHGRRDNKFKARIKILVRAMGRDAFAAEVEKTWADCKDNALTLTETEINRVKSFFQDPAYRQLPTHSWDDQNCPVGFMAWYRHNTHPHKTQGYRIVTLSLKKTGHAPGTISSEQLLAIADMADKYSFGQVRSTHEQNIVLTDVEEQSLIPLWQELKYWELATANIGCITDIICCPGGDFCSLANAKSIPIANAIQQRIDELDMVYDFGPMSLNISGCMNACSHHHVGNIGILGVDKRGGEYYQVSLGGNSQQNSRIGDILGPSFSANDLTDVIEEILQLYLDQRHPGESFLELYHRIGIQPFKDRIYAHAD